MKYESGRSMIEMLGVLAIMGIITGVAIVAISRAMDLQRRNTIVEEVAYIVPQVRSLYAEYDDFSNINEKTIFGAIGIKNVNTYGVLYDITTNATNPRQFVLSITKLSKSDCEYFVTKAWSDSVDYIASGGKKSGAVGQCNAADGKNVVKIIYGE